MRLPLASFALVACLSLGLSACSGFRGGEPGYSGYVSFGFEEASFTPCNSDESWWLGGGEYAAELERRFHDLGTPEYGRAFARVDGDLSERGQFGHLGAYARQIDIREVIEVRTASEQDCR